MLEQFTFWLPSIKYYCYISLYIQYKVWAYFWYVINQNSISFTNLVLLGIVYAILLFSLFYLWKHRLNLFLLFHFRQLDLGKIYIFWKSAFNFMAEGNWQVVHLKGVHQSCLDGHHIGECKFTNLAFKWLTLLSVCVEFEQCFCTPFQC